MNEQANPLRAADPQPRRRWLILALTAIAVVAAVSVGAALLNVSNGTPSASPTAGSTDTGDEGEQASTDPLLTITAPPTAPLSTDEKKEVARATDAVDAVITAGDEIGERGDGSAIGTDQIATGWVLGELQSRAREQMDLGYKQTGHAVVTEATVIQTDLDATPATIALRVCVDVSAIDITDASGKSLKDSLYNPGHPVAHIYGAVFEDSTWKISTHEIPDEQDCPAA